MHAVCKPQFSVSCAACQKLAACFCSYAEIYSTEPERSSSWRSTENGVELKVVSFWNSDSSFCCVHYPRAVSCFQYKALMHFYRIMIRNRLDRHLQESWQSVPFISAVSPQVLWGFPNILLCIIFFLNLPVGLMQSAMQRLCALNIKIAMKLLN